ncbi:MAG TPA: FmdE family protein [Methanomassiliicoccaceae archaeon]|jgi:formylmethanofuran dehydrogenase subunit E|nr:formylmethanofuran dehydrogenase [Euryarchaeota archaeon]HOB37602.1 FmdE family protein [Methanomassiliicoccaceae archaeon]HOK27822.1 FmdE family protein [Methanomassiliicoccaceae archaeon]HOL07878.1 FmdE family protein [Methanomassiliicoccaceae archaeon]HPT73600.1 FmdE family protein [Methanomassiliicoccaceae archaeon]
MYDDDWERCVSFHGHACPGLAMGYRAALYGLESLGIPKSRARDEEIVCISENEACGVDAIQLLTGCTVGKGNLLFLPLGKIAYTFFDRSTGKGVRIVSRPFDRNEDREKAMRHILTAKAEDLFENKPPQTVVPEKARLFLSVQCDECGESCREDRARLHEGKVLCLHCFKPYDRG